MSLLHLLLHLVTTGDVSNKNERPTAMELPPWERTPLERRSRPEATARDLWSLARRF